MLQEQRIFHTTLLPLSHGPQETILLRVLLPLDGVGPKKDRPIVLERAWNSIETNQFGTNEFMEWCKLVGTEPLMGMNFGTAGAEDAGVGASPDSSGQR